MQNNPKFREPKRNRQVPRLFFPFGRMKSLACETNACKVKTYMAIIKGRCMKIVATLSCTDTFVQQWCRN